MGERRHALASLVILASFAWAACTSQGAPEPTSTSPTTTSTSASPSASPAPTVELAGLKAEQPSSWKADSKTWVVTLAWDEPAGFLVDHYEVTRDGKKIAKDVKGTSFKDNGVEPGATFHYSVRGVDATGAGTTPATTVVKTKTPPVEDARLEGKFIAKLHITAQSNLKSGAQGGGAEIIFDPACKSGPCAAQVTFRGVSGSGSLARTGPSYDGTVHAAFHLQSCTGGTITETLVFHLRVTKAKVIHDSWRAEKVEGTLDETASASGCLTGHISYKVAGVVLA